MSALGEMNKEFVRVTGRHDADAAAKLYSPKAVVYDPQYPEPLRGEQAIRKDFEDFFRAFPDLKFEILSELEKSATEGAAEFRFTGTHKGPLAGPQGEIAPTNKRIEMRGASFYRVGSDGKITEERRYYDLATILGQLGIGEGSTAESPAEVGARR
jgi:steroid delta-isomerase-like uncharacterized protein